MAWTQQDIDAIKAKIMGVKSARSADESIENYELTELLKLLAEMEADVNPAARPRRTLAKYSSGLR